MEASIYQWERRDYKLNKTDWFAVKMVAIALVALIAGALYLFVTSIEPKAIATTDYTTAEACGMVKAGMPVHGANMKQVRELCKANGVNL